MTDKQKPLPYRSNVSYLFIPLKFDSFQDAAAALRQNKDWICVQNENLYLLKYIADKIDSRNPQNCQCFHFTLRDSSRQKFDIIEKNALYRTSAHTCCGQENRNFQFYLDSVSLYCFSTSVGIMAFRISFTENDPILIASAQYYLKKVSRETIYPVSGEASKSNDTFLSLAERLSGGIGLSVSPQIFYYANPSTERANILSLIEVEKKDNYKKELYYLRHCYKQDGFLFFESDEEDSREIYQASPDTVWGISAEAAVCLICPEDGRAQFLQNDFFRNFNTQYLFMYILLLHQKYVLYMFLTTLGVGTSNDLESLETYQHELYEFETDFVFSRITEVPQYQNLYNRMMEAFSLKELFDDVREPLTSLSDVRRIDEENKQKKQDMAVNRALFILSMLAFFSALTDGFSFIEMIGKWCFEEAVIQQIQIGYIIVLILILLYILKQIFSSKK